MPLPLDIVLVRHGQSEGNIAIASAAKGDDTYMTDKFKARHTSSYRLTDNGLAQANAAGEWIKKNLTPPYFGRYLTSEYLRAMETAATMDLPEADWQVDFFLREREWGDLDGLTATEQQDVFARNLKTKDSEPFYWTPPNGESFANLCSGRLMWVLNSLRRDYSDQTAIIVCHEEVIWGFRIVMEKLRQNEFAKMFVEKPNTRDKMVNCQIFHYSRRNPKNGQVLPYINWVRTVDPVGGTFDTGWQEIFTKKARFTNKELLDIVAGTPREIN